MRPNHYAQNVPPTSRIWPLMTHRFVFMIRMTLVTASLIANMACTNTHHTVSSQPSKQDIAEINRILGQQSQDWNRGDIEAFMQGYWQSPELSFSSMGNITYGWQQTLENYRARYADRQAMGHLTFNDVTITVLGPNAIEVLGSWHLKREQPIGGVFTLIFRRINNQWRIVHDHTSARPANQPNP